MLVVGTIDFQSTTLRAAVFRGIGITLLSSLLLPVAAGAAEPGLFPVASHRTVVARACPDCGKFHAGRACPAPRGKPAYPRSGPRVIPCPPGGEILEDAPVPSGRQSDRQLEELPPGRESRIDREGDQPLEGTDRARQEVDNAIDQANTTTGDTSGQESSLGATSSSQSNAPAMIGDFFGGGSTGRIVVTGPPTVGPGTSFNTLLFNNTGGQPVSVPVQLPGGFPSTTTPVSFISTDNPPFFPPSTFDSIDGAAAANAAFQCAQAYGTVSTFALALAENPQMTQNALAYFAAIYPPGTVLPTGQIATGGGSAANIPSGSTAEFDAASSPPTDAINPRQMSAADYYFLNWLYQYTPNVVTTPTIFIDVPNPSNAGGVVVGRMKIADNTSPIPRNRVFMNYSGFFNTPLAPGGVNVHRFVPGFEKTLFNGQASVEMRFPFASTIDTNFVAGGINSDGYVKWGNMSFTYKTLLTASTTFLTAGGLQVNIPTAGDVNVLLPGGTRVARVANSSVHLMPFLGALYTPDARFFAQGFLQLDVDANGNPVQVDPTFTGRNLTDVGRLNGPTFLYADLSVGYWMYRSQAANPRIMAFSPTVELHYNRSLQAADMVVNNNVVIGDFFSNFELLNMTVGCYTQFSPWTILTLGYNVPIGGGRDQQFDGELRVALNRRF